MNFIRKPFGYEPIITKEDLKKDHKKKVDKASDWKGVLKAYLEVSRRTTFSINHCTFDGSC